MLHGSSRGFIGDIFVVGVVLFVLFISLPIITGIGNMVTQQTIAENPQLNTTQIAALNTYNTNWTTNAPDIMAFMLYMILIICAFISAAYEGANPAVTLILGIIFLIVAELVSFGLADFAHAYISQTAYLNIAPHYGLTTYIMDYLPYFNGVLTIIYVVFVIMKREVIVGSAGGGGNVVVT